MMIRRLSIAFGLFLLLAGAGCKGTENVMGNPNGGSEGRTLASMMPYLTKKLTAPQAELTFGTPDAAQSGGSIIFVYNVEDGKKVNLGFPNPTDPISYAILQEKNGGTSPIPLKD